MQIKPICKIKTGFNLYRHLCYAADFLHFPLFSLFHMTGSCYLPVSCDLVVHFGFYKLLWLFSWAPSKVLRVMYWLFRALLNWSSLTSSFSYTALRLHPILLRMRPPSSLYFYHRSSWEFFLFLWFFLIGNTTEITFYFLLLHDVPS